MNLPLWFLTASSLGLATFGASVHVASQPVVSGHRAVGEIADDLDAPEYQILPDRGVDLVDGMLVGVEDLDGQLFGQGNRLTRGIYHNFTTESVTIALGKAQYIVEPGGVLGIGRDDSVNFVMAEEAPPSAQPGPPGSMICRDGYYACCVYAKEGKAGTAKCIKNTETIECDAGGPGSVACTTVTSI
jgi:hypothetical protein